MPWMRKSVPQRTTKATTIARIRRLIFILVDSSRDFLATLQGNPLLPSRGHDLELGLRWIDICSSSQRFVFSPRLCGRSFLCARELFSRAGLVFLRSDLGSFFKLHFCRFAAMPWAAAR